MKTENKKRVFLTFLLIAIPFIVLVVIGLWAFFSFFKFDYENRLLIDDVITELAVKLRPIPIYFFPYPRYVVESKDGGKYYYGFVEKFERQTEDDAMAKGQIIDSKAVLRTLGGREEKVDVYNPMTSFSYLLNGTGLFLKEADYSSGVGVVQVASRSLLDKKLLFLRAGSLRFNLRVGDFVRVSIDKDGSEEVYWYGTKNIFY